jgi:6-phosphogluconolactonase
MPQVPFREVMPWERSEFYFSDERGVAADDPASHFGNAHREMLRHVPTAEIQVHRMVDATGNYARQAAGYAALLQRIAPQRNGLPCLDLVILGIGSDGHVASLFPQGKAINQRDALVVAEEVAEVGWRLSLSLSVINNARQVWIVALGETKREAVTHCLQNAEPQLPAQQVTAAEKLVWWIDDAAAGEQATTSA